MKKLFFALSLIYITVIILLFSCNKPSYSPGTAGQTSLNQLFASIRSTPQTLSVTAGRDTIVYGANGTMLHFYTYSFKDAAGNIITSGTIDLQLTEMYKAGDMISNRATTFANGQILQSSGQINMVATLNGNEVYANSYGIGFKHGNSSSAPMALFYGASANSDSVATWTQSDSTKNGTTTTGTVTDTVSSTPKSYFYFDTCSSFTWANCDWFYTNDSPETTVSIVLPDNSFNATNTQMYLVLPNVNRWGNTADIFIAVLSNVEDKGLGSSSYTAKTNTLQLISEGNTNIVPAGLNYKLVVLANKNGTYYYYEQQGTIPHNGLTATATLVSQPESTIISNLAGL